MTYTKTELIDAFCRANNYNAENDGTKSEFLNKHKTEIQTRIDARTARMPTAVARMTEIAINKLQEEEKETNTVSIE